MLDADRLFTLTWLILFVALPVAVFASSRIRARLATVLPVAPIGIAVLFVFSFVLRHLAATTLTPSGTPSIYSTGHAAEEIFETTAEVLIAVAGYAAWRMARRSRART